MPNIEAQFNTDITALMDDAFGETFVNEAGASITAQFTLFRAEPQENFAGNQTEMVAELRWQESAFAAPSAEYQFKRSSDSSYWLMKEAPEVDGGEVIATVYQLKRNKTGAV